MNKIIFAGAIALCLVSFGAQAHAASFISSSPNTATPDSQGVTASSATIIQMQNEIAGLQSEVQTLHESAVKPASTAGIDPTVYWVEGDLSNVGGP